LLSTLALGSACSSTENEAIELGELGDGKADSATRQIPLSIEPGENILFAFYFSGDLTVRVAQSRSPCLGCGRIGTPHSPTVRSGFPRTRAKGSSRTSRSVRVSSMPSST
jgi:hypothetical protein